MAFTPHGTRLAQVNAAEELLHQVDRDRAYPLEFVIFRITGYHPRELSEELLAGRAIQHDLGLLIEQVSETLGLAVQSLDEPVLTTDDICERFNVTGKTIQRWRRRGLPGRRFAFPDGLRRVGFLLSSVERFFAVHRDQVARGTNFSQVGEIEREEILRRARRLALQCGCCQREIARRIARKLNRSPLTILHTIRKHDQDHPGDAIFPHSAQPLSEPARQRILRGFRRGTGISELARRIGRSRSAVYRVIVDDRIERLGHRKIKFIDDPLYHQPDAAEVIEQIVSQQEVLPEPRPEENRVPRDLPPYLQALYRTPLLSPAQERALFLKFNFHKYQFVSARRRLDPQFARLRHLEELERFQRAATETKNAILSANLRLVVSVARRHLRPGLSLMELISDGNLTLMRAVEGFDIHRGNRFSTYATFALMKGFARSVPQMAAARRANTTDAHLLESVPDHSGGDAANRLVDRDQVRLLLSQLSERERRVLAVHYGLDRDAALTYEQLSQRLGISQCRIRQIEKSAIGKLRRAAHS